MKKNPKYDLSTAVRGKYYGEKFVEVPYRLSPASIKLSDNDVKIILKALSLNYETADKGKQTIKRVYNKLAATL